MPIPRLTIVLGIAATLITTVSIKLSSAQDGDNNRQHLQVELVLPPKSEEPKSLIDQIRSSAGSTFLQNLALVMITAAVTGLAVPRIKSGMDLKYFREQKKHEATLTRQLKIIEQQTEFLKDFINVLWRFHFALVKVTYAHASAASEEEFKKIWDEYNNESWIILQDYRRIASTSVYLIKRVRYQRLLEIFKILVEKDIELTNKVEIRHSTSARDWLEYHNQLFFQFSVEIDNEIVSIAEEMGLIVETSSGLLAAK